MRRVLLLTVVLAAAMLGVAVAPVRPPDRQATDGTKKKTQLRPDRHLISTSGIGRILLGMTLAEVRQASREDPVDGGVDALMDCYPPGTEPVLA